MAVDSKEIMAAGAQEEHLLVLLQLSMELTSLTLLATLLRLRWMLLVPPDKERCLTAGELSTKVAEAEGVAGLTEAERGEGLAAPLMRQTPNPMSVS